MIKRRFYKFEHGDKDAPSESSSSSDSELEAEATEESEGEGEEEEDEEEGDEEGEENDNEDEVKVMEKIQSCLSSSGYESEDSSANDVNLDSSGLPTSDDDTGNRHARHIAMEGHLSDIQHNTASKDGDLSLDLADCAVKCKSVYKCRLCPRIVCLTVETLQAHLKSKRHARSEKLLKEGRLKLMLNDDGKIEGETPQKQQAPAEEEAPYTVNKKGKKRLRLSKRWLKRKKGSHAKFSRKDLAKKRRVNGN